MSSKIWINDFEIVQNSFFKKMPGTFDDSEFKELIKDARTFSLYCEIEDASISGYIKKDGSIIVEKLHRGRQPKPP